MKKLLPVISAVLVLVSCAQTEKIAVLKELPETAAVTAGTDTVRPFGPFFLPENHSLSSISLNYITGSPQQTTVYFTMVGEVDWVRSDPALKLHHRMVFKDLEESAVYQFTVSGTDSEISRSGTIQTMPFGEDYEFQFAIASLESGIGRDIKPNFIVLGSEKNQVSAEEFRSFYEKNRELLTSTILVPMFGIRFKDQDNVSYDLTAADDGFHFIRYKNLCLMLVTREMPDYDFLTRYLSDSPEDRNVIVMSHIGRDHVTELARRFALLNCQIYVYTRDPKFETPYPNVTPVDNYQLVDIIKRHSYALVLTNIAR